MARGDAVSPDDPFHQQEAAPGVLPGPEESIGHHVGGVVHCQQQYESGPSVLQPRVMAAVDLQQHALLGHPFPAYPVLGRTMLLGAGQAMAIEKAAYRLAAQVNTLPLRQHFGEVAVVESGVLVAGRDDRGGSDIFGDRVARLAAPVAVDQRGGPIPPVGSQDSPELEFTDPQKFRRLSPGKLIFHHAVEYLELCLLSLVQCHILHGRTFSLSKLRGRYRRAMTFVPS